MLKTPFPGIQKCPAVMRAETEALHVRKVSILEHSYLLEYNAV
jgi:hypothetical protein